jgi:upstream activation factor subunit UAF30
VKTDLFSFGVALYEVATGGIAVYTIEPPAWRAGSKPLLLRTNLIRYNSCDRGVRPRLRQGYGERKMAKTTPKAKNSAFMKPMQPSEHLAKIVGTEPLPRSEVTKKIWAHIKKHKLQNPKNKREILADDKLQPIFGSKKLDMFQMTKAVNKHLK